MYVARLTQVYDTTMAPRKRPETVRDTSYFGGMDDDAIEQVTSLNLIQTVEAQRGQWTITDVNLSPDNQWIVYSSISPYVGLSPVRHVDDDAGGAANQVTLDFSANTGQHSGVRRTHSRRSGRCASRATRARSSRARTTATSTCMTSRPSAACSASVRTTTT